MAQTKKKKHYTRRSRARSGKYKKNPGRRGHHSYGHRPRARYRRNTGHRVHRYRRNIGGGMGNLGNIALNAVFVIAGALGSKLLTQMVLGANNTGVIGYAGNAVSGGILWFLAEKVMRNRTAAHGIIAGTAVQIVLRLINDFTPFGQYVSQLGMGDYQAQSFVSPQVLVDPFNSTEIQIPAAYRALAAPAVAPGGVAGWQNISDYGAPGSY